MTDDSAEAQNLEKETPTGQQPQPEEKETSAEEKESEATPEISQEEKDSKKQQDFEKAYYKVHNELKTLKGEIAAKSAAPEPEETTEIDEGTQLLRNVVGEVLDEKLAPLRTASEVAEREKAIREVGSRPFAGDFAEEIARKASEFPKDMSAGDRLDRAYKDVVAAPENLQKIAKGFHEAGVDKGYTNKSTKEGLNKTLGDSPKTTGEEEPSIYDKYIKGDLTAKQIADNWSEIDKKNKEALGIS